MRTAPLPDSAFARRFLAAAACALLGACSSPYLPDAGDGGDASCDGHCDGGSIRRDATVSDARRDGQALDANVCPIAFADCDNDESNGCETMLGNLMNCGGCNNRCGTNQLCYSTGPGTFGCATMDMCPAPEVLCNGVCTNITIDPQHCGSCSTVCLPRDGGAAPECTSSRCVP